MELGDKISIIAQRDVERKEALQKKKETKDNLGAENEKLSVIHENFQKRVDAIDCLINKSHSLDKTLLPGHFDGISKEILLLQKYIANSNLFLRTYDIKKYQQFLQELLDRMKGIEEVLLPKKKFGFRNKPKVTKQPDKISTDQIDFQQKSFDFKVDFCGFENKKNESLSMNADEIFKKDVSLDNLQNCNVKLLGTPSTLHLNNLSNCKIFTGPVSTSIFASNCFDCTLVIACQQLRLHSSKNVNIYLHVTSRAIMEDCTEIFVAPYNLKYDKLQLDFAKSGLDINTNNWNQIDDFNWLNLEKQSPHWSLLDQEKITTVWEI